MSSHTANENLPALDLSKWRKVPTILIVVGGVLALLGAIFKTQQFGYSWLLAYMFFLSICLGGLFLVLVHHLFDAGWSVPIRRVNEHLAFLSVPMAILFIPIAILAPRIYPWMNKLAHHETDHAILAKQPLFTFPMFYIVAGLCIAAWIFFSYRLRYWSLRQDTTGEALCTFRMRRLAAIGIFFFAFTLTMAAIMWMKALSHHWFSTMYGVYYFAGSVWTTLATVYVLSALLKRQGPLGPVMREVQFYFIGTLLLAFTIFYAYIHFSQYFIIWNANMPEETFWYVLREEGSWYEIGLLIIFGHFFIPFLALLRIDAKLSLAVMVPLCAWAWLMQFVDLSYNIIPVLHPKGFVLHWVDIACFAFFAGVLAKVFLKYFAAHPPYPLKDPRLHEALGLPEPDSRGPSSAPERAK